MPRGKKICECGSENGVRSKHCKSCGKGFVFRVKSKEERTTKKIEVDWRELQKGDKIKVSGGPYFYKHDGESVPMGYSGKFVVDSLDDCGIRAFGVDRHSGFCHIYMGRDICNNETGMRKVKHRLKKILYKDAR
jgi:ribosomal protein L40E